MVDIPGPTPLRSIAATKLQPGATGAATRKVQKPATGSSAPPIVSLAKELASGTAPLDQSRIAEIRAGIASGTYGIDPDQIARALLGNS